MRKSSMGGGQENVRLFDYSKVPRFWAFSLAFLGKESHERNQSKEAIRRCGFLYKPVADPLLGLEEAPLPESIYYSSVDPVLC
jgi:hypothetical protein